MCHKWHLLLDTAMKSDEEKLIEYSHQMMHNQNCITRWAYRKMYFALYFELYLVR